MFGWLQRLFEAIFGRKNGRNDTVSDVREQQEQGQATAQCPDDIELFIMPKNGGTDWDLGPTNPPASGKATIVMNPGDPGKDIIIRLVGTGPGITFNTADPFWAVENQPCPPPDHSSSDQLQLVECGERKLTLHDPNTRQCTITYQMNFIGADPCDPEIRNGGGGGA